MATSWVARGCHLVRTSLSPQIRSCLLFSSRRHRNTPSWRGFQQCKTSNLLGSCCLTAAARANFWLRTTSPEHTEAFAQEHDRGIWKCLCQPLHVDPDSVSPSATTTASLPRWFPPSALGGFDAAGAPTPSRQRGTRPTEKGVEEKGNGTVDTRFLRHIVRPQLTDTEAALLRSQAGPIASAALTTIPSRKQFRLEPQSSSAFSSSRCLCLPVPAIVAVLSTSLATTVQRAGQQGCWGVAAGLGERGSTRVSRGRRTRPSERLRPGHGPSRFQLVGRTQVGSGGRRVTAGAHNWPSIPQWSGTPQRGARTQ